MSTGYEATVCIPLTRGKHALIDAADYAVVSKLGWRLVAKSDGRFYAAANHTCKLMHRLILGASESQVVDHRNGNGLDNRRSNIRISTVSENRANSAKRKDSNLPYKGIGRTRTGRWTAQVAFYGKRYRTPTFATPLEAALAYDALAIRVQGEFARPNFTHAPEAAAPSESRAEDRLVPADFLMCQEAGKG